MTTYRVWIMFGGGWWPIGTEYNSRSDAWWAVSRHRQESQTMCDSHFMVYEERSAPSAGSNQVESIDLAALERDSRPKGA